MIDTKLIDHTIKFLSEDKYALILTYTPKKGDPRKVIFQINSHALTHDFANTLRMNIDSFVKTLA